MNRVHIRTPDPDETPLSEAEQWIAVRMGYEEARGPKWHPELIRNWSVMSARVHRAAALADHPAHARATEGAPSP